MSPRRVGFGRSDIQTEAFNPRLFLCFIGHFNEHFGEYETKNKSNFVNRTPGSAKIVPSAPQNALNHNVTASIRLSKIQCNTIEQTLKSDSATTVRVRRDAVYHYIASSCTRRRRNEIHLWPNLGYGGCFHCFCSVAGFFKPMWFPCDWPCQESGDDDELELCWSWRWYER